MANSMSTNLMVIDVAEALQFYCDVIGGEIAFVVDADRQTSMDGSIPGRPAFASVRIGDNELMLQERVSLAEDAPIVPAAVLSSHHHIRTIWRRETTPGVVV